MYKQWHEGYYKNLVNKDENRDDLVFKEYSKIIDRSTMKYIRTVFHPYNSFANNSFICELLSPFS